MKARYLVLALLGAVALGLEGCDQGADNGAAGSGDGAGKSPGAVVSCLQRHESLRVKAYPDTAGAVAAFAEAAADCGASAKQLEAQAVRMQEDGTRIEREGE